MLQAVQQHGGSIQFALTERRNAPTIVLAAVNMSGFEEWKAGGWWGNMGGRQAVLDKTPPLSPPKASSWNKEHEGGADGGAGAEAADAALLQC